MGYKQTIFDDFNDNSLNTTKWTVVTGGSYISESSQRLNVTNNPVYSFFHSQRLWDIRDGIVAFKLSRTGTTDPGFGDEFNIMMEDASENSIGIYFTPHTADYSSTAWGNASVGGEELYDTTVGFGPSWTNGTWIGIGGVRYNGVNTNWAYLYKSTDGINWTAMARFDIYGVNTSAVGLLINLGRWGGSSTFAIQMDDVSFFDYRTKVRVGGAWVNAKPKVRSGGAWVNARPVARKDGAWASLR